MKKTTKTVKENPLAKFTMEELRKEINRRPDERVENLLLDLRASFKTITDRRDRRHCIESVLENSRYLFEDYNGEFISSHNIDD